MDPHTTGFDNPIYQSLSLPNQQDVLLCFVPFQRISWCPVQAPSFTVISWHTQVDDISWPSATLLDLSSEPLLYGAYPSIDLLITPTFFSFMSFIISWRLLLVVFWYFYVCFRMGLLYLLYCSIVFVAVYYSSKQYIKDFQRTQPLVYFLWQIQDTPSPSSYLPPETPSDFLASLAQAASFSIFPLIFLPPAFFSLAIPFLPLIAFLFL